MSDWNNVKPTSALRKVTAYITRRCSNGKEVLVFRHPLAGLQLPAGTVEDGQSPADAVLREVEEETGIAGARIITELLVEETTVPDHQRAVLNPTPLLAEPHPGAEQIDTVGRTGFLIDVGEVGGDYRRVTQRHYEFDGEAFHPVRSVPGWVLDCELTSRMVRHHYEIAVDSPTAERWVHAEYQDFPYDLFWAPLGEDIGLVASNREWLRLVIDKLLG